MDQNRKTLIMMAFVVILIIASLVAYATSTSDQTLGPAPDFQATDTEGGSFNLSDLSGEAMVIHITSIEDPICVECEKELKAQTEELERLKEQRPGLTIITINVRKNPYSDPGDQLAGQWWGINVTWHWVEDLDPYPLSSRYLDYWSLEGGTANPTILLVDQEQQIAGVYHVYQMGKGEIDGIQTAEMLDEKITSLEQGTWEGIEGEMSSQRNNFLGMFALGIITSFSPCSIALLIAMLSYVMTTTQVESRDPEKSPAREGLIIGVAFTLGMASVFFVIGLFISSMGALIQASPYFYLAAGFLLVILGVHNIRSLSEILEPIRNRFRREPKENVDDITFTERLTNLSIKISEQSIFLGAFVLGIFFALGWAPCAISLVLPVLIWMAAQSVSVLIGALLLFTFGIGHGIIVIPLTTASRAMRGRIGERYVKIGRWIPKVFGIAIILIGAIFAARYFGYYLW